MKKTILTVLMLTVILCGCSTLKRWFGLNKTSPDETKIETRAPLVLPPDFDELP